MSAVIPYTDDSGPSVSKNITWRNPATYESGTEIPPVLKAMIETRLYFSLDLLRWVQFATVSGGAESWKGTLPVDEGTTGYYAATSRIPDGGTAVFGDNGAVAFRASLLPTGDTFVGGGDDLNHSGEPRIGTYTWPANVVVNRGLLQWIPLEIPPDASVGSATLWLYYYAEEGDGGDDDYTVSVSKVVGVRPVIERATWNSYDNVSPWLGGKKGAAANLARAESSATIGKRHRWVKWDVTEMIQEWVTFPERNNGLGLDGDANANADSNRFFASMEHPDPALWPRLEVEYRRSSSPDGAGPVPGSQGWDSGGEEGRLDLGPPAPGFIVAMEPVEDTWVGMAQNSETNFSTHHQLRTYTWPRNNVANRGFIHWDLSGLPPDIAVANATLWLYYVDEDHGGKDDDYTVAVSKVTGVNPDLSIVTWNTYDGFSSWPGGKNGGAEAKAPGTASSTIGKTHRWVSWDVTDMVREWADEPGTNFGMAIDSDASASADSNRYFASREYPDPRLRPRLLITYTKNR